MEALAVAPAVEAIEASPEDGELKLLAFKAWQRASCPEKVTEEDWSDAEALCYALGAPRL